MEKRKELEAIRAQLGELETEAKPFDVNEPIKIVQVYSSIAGQGSGEYHLYRKQKAREEERQRRMDEEWNDAVAKLEMQKRRLEREAAEEAERELKRAKRQRKKEAQKQQKMKEKQLQVVGVAEGEFLEVMERKERLKAMLLQQAAAEGSNGGEEQERETDADKLTTSAESTKPDGEAQEATADGGAEDDEVTARLAAAKARLRALAADAETDQKPVTSDVADASPPK